MRGQERHMKRILGGLTVVIAAVLAGCAGQTEQLSMQRPQQGPQPQAPQSVRRSYSLYCLLSWR